MHLRQIFIFIMLLVLPCTAKADAGIPMLMLMEPVFVVSLIFVVLIEAYIIQRKIRSKTRETLKAVSISNLISTLVGVPLSWIFVFSLQSLLLRLSHIFHCSFKTMNQILLAPAWLSPISQEGWKLYAIFIWSSFYLLIICYLVSAWIETKINRFCLKNYDSLLVKKATWQANIYSYFFLFFLLVFYWIEMDQIKFPSYIDQAFYAFFYFVLFLFFRY